MLFVDRLDPIVDSVPEYDLGVHRGSGYKLQLGHRDYLGDYQSMQVVSRSLKHFLGIGFEVPHHHSPVVEAAVEDLIDGIPGQAVDFLAEMVLD